MNINPYSPPVDPNQNSNANADRTLFRRNEEKPYQICEFQVDASIAGIRAQRASPLHRVFDALMVPGTLIMIASLLPVWNSPVSWFCIVFPLWFFLGIVWLVNFTFRRGDDFAATCPGLIGKVTGRFSIRQLEMHGPEICMACDVTEKEVRQTRKGITIKVPGTEQFLEIRDQDIVQTVSSVDGRWRDKVGIGLLDESGRRALADGRVVIGERQLHGRDLLGLSTHRRNRNQAVVAGGLACSFVMIAFLTYLQIPQGVFDYAAGDIKRMPYDRMIVMVYFLLIFSLPLAAFCVHRATKRFRVQGTYNIVVSQDVVSVAKASQNDRAGMTKAGLKQVCWSDHGLKIVGKKERLLFLLPRHWFDEEQQDRLAERFGKKTNPVVRDCYFGPRL